MKRKKEPSDEIVSILGEGVELVGELVFSHGLRVDGFIKGKLQSEAYLAVGPRGKVEADAYVRRVAINGEFRGSIHASDRVTVHKEGKIYGDIYTPCLIIEAGAVFEGRCNMSEAGADTSGDKSVLKAVDATGGAGLQKDPK
jgi:cytoskeletal protein CcmA (bactofilin family)